MKRGRDEKLVQKVIKMLANGETLPAEYKTHKLKGKYKNCFECHIQPDWLLVWQQNEKELILILIDTGTHSDLF
jgi:mRNA interferase YafQ